ncbi:MAG TPA: winged helix-turn-helix transcriptional regulator [Xanthomonadales bacterium]|nr:winged helix-turn-helix transcriptional regulator [Xanthomonadales bacterium]
MSQWTLFSNHGHVLLYLAREPDARLRDVAENVGITERAVQKIVRDLQEGGVISVRKQGRRNRYRINGRKPLRHPLEAHRSIGGLVKLMRKDEAATSSPAASPKPQTRSAGKPAPVLQPAPDPEPPGRPVVEPKPESKPEPGADSKSKAAAPAKKKAARRRAKRPADEQQGSLF